MKNIICLIPARGGSKGIPKKNIKQVAGMPLIAHTLVHAKLSTYITHTVVSTDDLSIKKIAEEYGALVIDRPQSISNDSATSESALKHALEYLTDKLNLSPDLVVFLQCTSPIRESDDIDNAIRQFLNGNADSMLSVTPSHKFLWKKKEILPQASILIIKTVLGDRKHLHNLVKTDRFIFSNHGS